MIQLSTSLERRLMREAIRHTGSLGKLVFYKGAIPHSCEDSAGGGEKVMSVPATEEIMRSIAIGNEPMLVEGSGYWRIYDNGGLVVMQGDNR